GKLLIAISVAALVFHLLIVIKVIPYAITWGGRLKTDSEMYLFETVSIGMNLFFIFWCCSVWTWSARCWVKKQQPFFYGFSLCCLGSTPLEIFLRPPRWSNGFPYLRWPMHS
ncbi:MAG: hypothetical protein ACKOEV_10420, partial [Cytophagales bacterium]